MDATLTRSQRSRGSNASTDLTPDDSSHDSDMRPWNEDNAQIVLVLVGLIGSGKTTFAKALDEEFPEIRRCNQDDLGDRKAVERLARASLQQGLSVCIDRTNFDETQRSHWIRIAREFPRTRLWCIIFDTPIHICRERLKQRTNHPTIHSPEQGIEVLHRFKNMFKPPSADEGFERIFNLKPEDQPSASYSRDVLQTLLMRVATSPLPKRSALQRGIREYFEAVTPPETERRTNWRDRNLNREGSGCGVGSRHPWHDRKSGRNSSDSAFRSSGPRQLSPQNIWKGHSAPVQVNWRRPHEQVENVFQNDSRTGMAAEQALHSRSQYAPDRTLPSKQAGDGTTENPNLID